MVRIMKLPIETQEISVSRSHTNVVKTLDTFYINLSWVDFPWRLQKPLMFLKLHYIFLKANTQTFFTVFVLTNYFQVGKGQIWFSQMKMTHPSDLFAETDREVTVSSFSCNGAHNTAFLEIFQRASGLEFGLPGQGWSHFKFKREIKPP